MFQHLVAGIAMLVFHLHSALNLQDKLGFSGIATPMKTGICTSPVICMRMILLLQP